MTNKNNKNIRNDRIKISNRKKKVKRNKFIAKTVIFFIIVIIIAILFLNIFRNVNYLGKLFVNDEYKLDQKTDEKVQANDLKEEDDQVQNELSDIKQNENTDSKENESFITYPTSAYTKGSLDPQKLDSKPALNQDNNLILVNKEYVVDESFVPDVVEVEGYYLQQVAADAYSDMKSAALQSGVTLQIGSAYRSYDYQVDLFDSYLQQDPYEEVITYSAYPGTSEHQTGLVIDFSEYGTCDFSECFENTLSGRWLFENAYKYGFILRYPKGKEDITGYMYEPWHYRYVGKEVAYQIYNNNQTLEEYILL